VHEDGVKRPNRAFLRVNRRSGKRGATVETPVP
jgi:hypothetical protein